MRGSVIEQGNVSGPYGLSGVDDRFNLRLDRGNDGGVRRDRFLLTGVYQLPFGKGKPFLANSGRVVDAVLGNWQLSTITLAQTGPYETPMTATRTTANRTSTRSVAQR